MVTIIRSLRQTIKFPTPVAPEEILQVTALPIHMYEAPIVT